MATMAAINHQAHNAFCVAGSLAYNMLKYSLFEIGALQGNGTTLVKFLHPSCEHIVNVEIVGNHGDTHGALRCIPIFP
jgi:hypothetical protein